MQPEQNNAGNAGESEQQLIISLNEKNRREDRFWRLLTGALVASALVLTPDSSRNSSAGIPSKEDLKDTLVTVSANAIGGKLDAPSIAARLDLDLTGDRNQPLFYVALVKDGESEARQVPVTPATLNAWKPFLEAVRGRPDSALQR